MKPRIAIVGAGPAGSSLSIRLAQNGFDVFLIEREKFPRHKLCGEFISPECFGHFASLGVLDTMTSAGGDRVFETSFYSPNGRSVTVPSLVFGEERALSLSRAEMDLQLMDRAKQSGVQVFESSVPIELREDKGKLTGLLVRTADGNNVSIDADVFVDATGRAAALSRLLKKSSTTRQAIPVRSRFVGFKAHLRNANLAPGRCEIYTFRGGYGGITNVEGGLVNLCFLINAEIVREFKSDADEIVRKVVMRSTRAKSALSGAVPVGEWLAVAVNSFGRKPLNPAINLFTVGDSAAFIDPFTGSGMLLALESSELLAEAITENAHNPATIAEHYSRNYSRRFGSRLRIASLLRRAAFVPFLATLAITFAGASVEITNLLARFTRRDAISALSKR